MVHRFYKEPSEQWYIDLPDFIEQGGSKAALQMVAGADTMLDVLSGNTDEVRLAISTAHMEEYDCVLVKAKEASYDGDAGCDYYAVLPEREEKADVWLCQVTTYVFEGRYPDAIFVRVVK